jgi:hypothetical protein
MGLDDELKEAREVFGSIKEREWLPWAGDILMVDFAKEVEAERKEEEEEEKRRAAAEEERRKWEEEEACRQQQIREQAEVEERRKVEVQEKFEKEMEKLVDEVGEGKISTEEFERREQEMERKKARELEEEEDEKKDEDEVAEKVREKVVVEVPRAGEKRGRGRLKRKASEGGETDVEGAEIGTVYIVDRERMVSKLFISLFLSFLIFYDCFIVRAM